MLGLELNVKKCELISAPGTSMEGCLKEFVQIPSEEAMLLGAPLFRGEAMDKMLETHCSTLVSSLERLKTISRHDALVLLRASFGAPRVMHTLRSSPCAGHPELERFDSLMHRGLADIMNIAITDGQWLQASLPVRDGGLGLRRVQLLAPSAFLASAASTRSLQDEILSDCAMVPDVDGAVRFSLDVWTSGHPVPLPVVPSSGCQREWDRPGVEADLAMVRAAAIDPCDKARLLAVSAPHGSDWLHALPLACCGLRLEDEAVRVAVGLRLGSVLCEPHPCPCGETVDAKGHHGLACRRSRGRMPRHHFLNDIVWRALMRADIPAVKEPQGLLRGDGKRPDGLTLVPWRGGKSITWDVTVVDTLARSNLVKTSLVRGGAAEAAALSKETKYTPLIGPYIFIPIAVETLGPVNESALEFLADLGRRTSVVTGDDRESAFLLQRVSMAVQRFNAVSFRGAFLNEEETDTRATPQERF